MNFLYDFHSIYCTIQCTTYSYVYVKAWQAISFAFLMYPSVLYKGPEVDKNNSLTDFMSTAAYVSIRKLNILSCIYIVHKLAFFITTSRTHRRRSETKHLTVISHWYTL